MDGKRQQISSPAATVAKQVVGALSAGHVQRHGTPRPAAPGLDAKRQATAAAPAFVAPMQPTPTMIPREHEVVRDRAGQMKQIAIAAASSCHAGARRGTAFSATFKRKHAELCAEAANFAADFGADVCIYAVARDGTNGTRDRFPGATGRPGGDQQGAMRQLLGKDVASMGLEEAKAHEAQLLELRAAAVPKLQQIETAEAAAAARPSKIIRLE